MSNPEDGPVELPPNTPPGMLGEPELHVLKTDTFKPDGLNAGLIQESTWETRWLTIVLAYLLFFPAAFGLVWLSKRLTRRTKAITTLVMLAGIALIASQILR